MDLTSHFLLGAAAVAWKLRYTHKIVSVYVSMTG